MRKPKDGSTISISGHEYELHYVKGLVNYKGDGLWGLYKAHTGEVLIEADCPQRQSAQTLIHEIVHGILEHSGFSGGDDDERIANAIAYGLTSVRINGKSILR